MEAPGRPRPGLLTPAEAAAPAKLRLIVAALVFMVGGLGAALVVAPAMLIPVTLWWGLVVVVIRSDLEAFIIPDAASAGIAALGLAQTVVAVSRATSDLDSLAAALMSAAASAAIAFAVFWLVAWGFRRRTGRDGLGFGDVKLAAASAVWLAPGEQVLALEMACLSAVVVVALARRGRGLGEVAIPFGAFLAPSAWFAFVAAPPLWRLMGDA